MHIGNGAVERAIQTMKNLVLANMEDGNNLTGRVNRALKVMRFTIQTGLKKTPFELHHGRKTRTELTNIKKRRKIFCQIGQNCPFQHQIGPKYQYMSDETLTGKIPITRWWPERKPKNGNWLRTHNHRGKETRLDIHLKLWKKDIIENP